MDLKLKIFYLPVGGDQRYVDFNLKERIDYYNDRSKNDFEYVESIAISSLMN